MKTGAVINKKKRAVKEEQKGPAFPIVAIGASAGGLEAVTELLRGLSPTTGMAYIYVQHLSPDHKSILTSLLAKVTPMPVQEVIDKALMEPDNLYVIPPDKGMVVTDGHIKLTPRVKGPVLPIDAFFCSLAEKHKEAAIGVILSGSATDGTRGITAIKDFGGLTFAQDSSAKFDSMPKSAIASGSVDFILSPREIGVELTRLSQHDYMKGGPHEVDKETKNNSPELTTIIELLSKETSVDFREYKIETVKRRILRRMLLNKSKSLQDYIAYLEKNPEEAKILFQDLLINVTSFFRDSDVHQFLKKTLFPKILRGITQGEALRIWVPACSTGEEVYSIAMTLFELDQGTKTNHRFQIFATDISDQAITKARIGEYSIDQMKSISPHRLQRFYTKIGNRYRVIKELREICVFATHNVLTDPPFSKIDFISCRNLLIYLDTEAQQNVITTLHYALKSDGYLMLGKAETVGRSNEFFVQLDRKYKIYKRKEKVGKPKSHALPGRLVGATINKNSNPPKIKGTLDKSFTSDIDTILLSQYVPAGVVINHAMDILQFRGATDLFLKHSPGKASLNILKLILPELAFELRYAISAAVKQKQPVRKTGIEINSGTVTRIVNLEVISVPSNWKEPLLLVLFTEPDQVETFLPATSARTRGALEKNRTIIKLKKELQMVRADMKTYVHEQETFTEELQSANEEVVSSNEELQSVNEELETSKEEIESTNEELITTNQELETRNELLNESYDYSEAIINTIHEPMLILDRDLRVKSVNQSFYKIFKVSKEETEGTLMFELGNKQWDIPSLRELLIGVIPKNTHFHDFEVTHNFFGIGPKTMLLNASRIVQKSHGEQLILLAINDITEHALLQLKEKELLKKDALDSKSYSLKLEKAVLERTKELEQLNVVLAEKNQELEKMNTELEAFAYVSSHDLQEPLRKIQTFASRILETETLNLSERGKDYFNRMQIASARMKKLIEDLLAFSRLSISDRQFESTDINKIVAEVKIELREVIEEKRATIEAVDLGVLNIIPFQFRQLMYNLINNSLKFSQSKQDPYITISSKIVDGSSLRSDKIVSDKQYCRITVSDNGIGFDQQYKDRIFEVFQKLHGKHEYAGTGIGLAIVKKVVENHNGIITVTSKINKGTTFNIYFPVAG